MLTYLTSEIAFIRAFGNRGLFLIILCALSRSSDTTEKASVIGLSIDLSPGIVVVFGPILALLIMIAMKLESDNLTRAREASLEEAFKLNLPLGSITGWYPLLFGTPTLAALFMLLQFLLKLTPDTNGSCNAFGWVHHFTDIYSGPSVYCIGNITKGNPWIYLPYQTYFYVACVLCCGYLTFRIATDWARFRNKHK